MSAEARGIRNNNPGNIDYIPPPKNFRGQIGLEIVPPSETYKPRFGRYDTPHNGIRALAKQILVDHRNGLTTVLAIISSWAPDKDGNNTMAYASRVAAKLGVGVESYVNAAYAANLFTLTKAIIGVEDVDYPYTDADIWAAVDDALGLSAAPNTAPTASTTAPEPAKMQGYRTIIFNAAMAGIGLLGLHIAPTVTNQWLDMFVALWAVGGIVLRQFTTTPVGKKVVAEIPAQFGGLVSSLENAGAGSTLDNAIATLVTSANTLAGHPLLDPVKSAALASLADSLLTPPVPADVPVPAAAPSATVAAAPATAVPALQPLPQPNPPAAQ